MNNAKMRLVVAPSVGVPLFLGAVAVGSFAVHVAVLTNTSWVTDFLSGNPLGSGDAVAAAQITPGMETANASYVLPLASGQQEVTVILPDGTLARAILQPNNVLASVNPVPLATD